MGGILCAPGVLPSLRSITMHTSFNRASVRGYRDSVPRFGRIACARQSAVQLVEVKAAKVRRRAQELLRKDIDPKTPRRWRRHHALERIAA